MERDAQIRQTAAEWLRYNHPTCTQDMLVEAFRCGAEWADRNQPNPWITDRDPEIKGSTSDAVLLLVDGMFYKVSRLERRKDGSEFWWGVDVVNGEEVTAWMPIPQEPRNDN